MKKSKFKKNYKKKSFKKNYKSTKYMKLSPRNTLMPPKYMTQLRYVEDFDIMNPPLGGPAIRIFRANSIRDPYQPLGGHAARGFDQFMAMYNHFTVIGSKCTATFFLTATENMCMFNSLRAGTGVLTTNDYLESRSTSYKYASSTAETHPPPTRITKSFSCKSFLGVKSPLSETDVRGSFNDDPVEQAYYHIGAGAIDPLFDPPSVRIAVHLEYLVVFTEPRIPPQS